MLRRIINNFIPSFGCVTFAYCFFYMFVFLREGIMLEISYVTLIFFTAISVIINIILSLKSRYLWVVACVNMIVLIGFELIVFLTQVTFIGVFISIFIGAIVAVTVIAPLLFSLSPMTSNRALLFAEVSIVGTTFFFFVQFGGFDSRTILNVACIVAIVLNLFLLSSLRIEKTRKENLSSSYMRGFIIAAVFVIVFAVASALAIALIPSIRSGIVAGLLAIKNAIVFAVTKVVSFLGYLLSLLPISDDEYVPIDMPTAEGVEQAQEVENLTMNFDAVIMIIGLVIAFLIAFFIMKLSKNKIKFKSIYDSIEKEAIDRSASKNPIVILIKKLIARIKFIKSWLLRRSTYEGAFVTVSLCASKRGFNRKDDETPREYFSRVLAYVYKEASDSAPVHKVLDNISSRVDSHVFALNSEKYSVMLSEERSVFEEFIKLLRRVPKPPKR